MLSTSPRSGVDPQDAEAKPDNRSSAAPRRMPRFGVAVFDSEHHMDAGWACASDGDPFYFTALTELTNDAIWITSADWAEYQSRGQRMHNLRRIDYLKTNILRVATDLGLRTDGHHARAAVHALARVAQNSVAMAASLYGWTDPASDIREDVLYEDIRRSLVEPPKPKDHILPALCAAYQGSSTPLWPHGYEEAVMTLTLRYNRLDYVRDLLEQPVPDEGWTVQLRGDQFRRSGLTMDDLLNPDRPSLVEATVEMSGARPDLATIAAFGSQPGRRTTLRRWISQPELAWLMQVGRVHIQTALISLDKRDLPEAAKLPPALTADPLYSLSISAGLVAESHFQALASERYNRMLRRKTVTAWGVWLRAYDRARTFELAVAAHEAGFTPIAYGGGAVTVRFPRARLPELLAFAIDHGIAHPAMHPLFVEHGFAEAGCALNL